MVTVLMKQGLSAMPVLVLLSARMMKYQGLGGALGFMAGVGMVGQRGKAIAQRFAEAVNAGDTAVLHGLFTDDARVAVPHGGPAVKPADVPAALGGRLRFGKVLQAGYAVTCSLVLEAKDGTQKEGVAIFEFMTKSGKIQALRFYFE